MTSLANWKVARPHPRAGVVLRPRLFRILDQRADAALTLITAPAGSGKTELLASWLDNRPELAVAWVSLDQGHADPVRFWTQVADSVDRVRSGMARPARALLRRTSTRVEEAVDELMNGIDTFDGRLVIAIDDLHHFASRHEAVSLAYAVDHLPASARIVATTRADPVLRLARLRARGAVVTIRGEQLAFTVSEARELLVERMEVDLSTDDVALLVARTEGWPAVLSLAGLWLAEVEDPANEVRSFDGDHRQIADYLTEEVLDTLDDETRSFMIQTSVLERLSGSLCDAVLGVEGSNRRLAELSRSNLFVLPLDRRGEWYRYHQLFRSLLVLELTQGDPNAPVELHRRAAAWFVEHGHIEEALEHTAATGAASGVATLLAEHYLTLFREGSLETLMTWLLRLPEDELRKHAELAAAGAVVCSLLGRPVDERARLIDVAESEMGTAGQPLALRVGAITAIARAVAIVDDLSSVIESARDGVQLARSADDGEVLVGALGVLAYALYLRGDVEDAALAVEEALGRPEAPRRPHGYLYVTACAALIELDRGHTRRAVDVARRSVDDARALGLAGIETAALGRLALGQALLESGAAAEAERHLERAEALRRAAQPTLEHIHAVLVLAEARIARGRLPLASTALHGALESLDSFVDAGRLPALAGRIRSLLDEALAQTRRVVEAPTPAELAVLTLLATELSQRQIAQELFLSFNTVKTHSRNLYRKLGASSRDDAVRRAAEVGLLR